MPPTSGDTSTTGTHQPDKASVFCLQSISFTKEWQLTYLDLKTGKTAQEGFQSIGVTKEWRQVLPLPMIY